MIKNDKAGKLTGWEPGKRIELVRNPNWDAETDFRPAYLDEIEVRQGNDATVAQPPDPRGEGMVTGDFTAPPTPILKEASQPYKDQLELPPSRRHPLRLAEHQGRAVRRPERAQGDHRRHGPRRRCA